MSRLNDIYSTEDYGAIFDAHIHTYLDTHDGMIIPDELIQLTIRKKFNWVLGMAHDTVLGNSHIKQLAKENGLPFIPGIEISTVYNHILAYGVQEWPYVRVGITPDQAIDELRAQGCAIFFSHPYLTDMHWTPELYAKLQVDGVEWWNASNYFLNKKTWENYSFIPKGRRISGTDAHHPSAFGYAFTQVDVNSDDSDDLVAAMRKGKCTPYCGDIPIHRTIYMMLVTTFHNKLRKRRKIGNKWVKPDGDRIGAIPHPDYKGPLFKDGSKKRKEFCGRWVEELFKVSEGTNL